MGQNIIEQKECASKEAVLTLPQTNQNVQNHTSVGKETCFIRAHLAHRVVERLAMLVLQNELPHLPAAKSTAAGCSVLSRRDSKRWLPGPGRNPSCQRVHHVRSPL